MTFAASGLDADAAAYIAAVQAAGVTDAHLADLELPPLSAIQLAIDTFIRVEKIGLRWDLIKRLYLPIWGLAAANAICMRSLTSGPFVGAVTHGAGFMQGDGTSGYFDTESAPDTVGITHGDETYGVMYLDRPTTYPSSIFGVRQLPSSPFEWVSFPWITSSSARLRCRGQNNAGGNLTVSQNHSAVVRSNSLSSRNLLFLKGGSIVLSVGNAATESSSVITRPMYLMAENSIGTAGGFSDAKICQFFMATALTNSQIQGLTQNQETLLEACTGITLT